MIKKWKEILMVIVGSMMMGASIDLFVQADFGLDPLSLFQAGLGRVLHLSLGTTSQVLMIPSLSFCSLSTGNGSESVLS